MRQYRTYSISQPHTYTSEKDMLQDTWDVDGGSFFPSLAPYQYMRGAGRGEALI